MGRRVTVAGLLVAGVLGAWGCGAAGARTGDGGVTADAADAAADPGDGTDPGRDLPPGDAPRDVPGDDLGDAPGDTGGEGPADVPADAGGDARPGDAADVPVDAPADVPADGAVDTPSDLPADLPTDGTDLDEAQAPTDPGADLGADPGADAADDAADDAPVDTGPPPCPAFAEPAKAGTVTAPDLREASGLAASRTHPGVLWTHNDSGDSARIFALQADGTLLGRFILEGVSARDFEDIARGPLAGLAGDAIFVGDVGDNGRNRASVVVHVVAEPASPVADPQATLPVLASLVLAYPGGPADCEAIFVDPVDGALYLVAKEALEPEPYVFVSRVFRKAPPHVNTAAPVTLEEVARIPTSIATGASASGDGSLLVVRTYVGGVLFRRTPGQTVAAALAGEACEMPGFPTEPQGEAIALAPDGSGYTTVSEWRNGVSQDLHWTALGAARQGNW